MSDEQSSAALSLQWIRWSFGLVGHSRKRLMSHLRRTQLRILVTGSVINMVATTATRFATAIMSVVVTRHVISSTTGDGRRHTVSPLTGSAETIVLGSAMFSLVMLLGLRRLDPPLRGVKPDRNIRDRIGVRLEAVIKKPWVPRGVSRAVSSSLKADQRHSWIITTVLFASCLVGAGVLSQIYSQRLQLGAGGAIATLGPVANGFRLAFRSEDKTACFFPLLTAAGILTMLPWGTHVDHWGLAAAFGAAVCSAGLLTFGQAQAKAGFANKGAWIAGAVASLPAGAVLVLHWHEHWWNWDILQRGIIAGFLAGVFGPLMYNLSNGPFRLPKRANAVLAGLGPSIGAAVGLIMLGQSILAVTLVGMVLTISSGSLNTVLGGSLIPARNFFRRASMAVQRR